MNGTRIKGFLMSTLILLSMLALVFNIQPVKAQTRTIYIRVDGSVYPSTANITSLDNVTYTFTDDNYDEVVVERSSIIIDGNGYTLQGTGSGNGSYLSGINNVTIKNTNIKYFDFGIVLSYSSNNTISGNNITANNVCGIYLWESSNYNSIFGNNITNNEYGILPDESSYNIISGNNITNSEHGIWLEPSSPEPSLNYNIFYHNNFINNTQQVYSYASTNVWDDGYPSGGNYWSDYTGLDGYSGSHQNETGSDGIGDTPYIIDENNKDNYPLMVMYEEYLKGIDVAPPVANAGPNQTVNQNTIVTFNGSGSTDDTAIAEYTWSFTDVTAKILTGVHPTYNFTNPGIYVVTLNVSDTAGNWATATVNITVLDITPPVAQATASSTTVKVNTEVTFSASGSTDNVGIVSYQWDFGDGNTGTGMSASHTYVNGGTYTVTLTVEDAAGNSDAATLIITVEVPIWQQTWFIGAVAGAVVVVVTVTVILRKKREAS